MREKREKKSSINFENLEVWQESCALATEIYILARESDIRKDFGLKDQITRAAVSIPSNIAEGKERETIAELIRYLYYAKGSAGELRTQLYISNQIGYIDEAIFKGLNQKVIILSQKLGNFIKTLKKSKMRERV